MGADSAVECGVVVTEEECRDLPSAVLLHFHVRHRLAVVRPSVDRVRPLVDRAPLSTDLRLVDLPQVDQLEVAAQVRCRFHVQVPVEHD